MTNPMQFNIHVDLSALERDLKEHADNIPYAFAKAINLTATDAQDAVRKHLAQVMHIRRPNYVNKSVKIKPFANKHTLEATISITPPGSAQDVLSKFEDGGSKSAITGNVAIPSSQLQPDITKLLPRSKRPRNIKGAFKVTTSGGKEFLFKHVSAHNPALKLLYVLKPSVPIAPILDFKSTIQKTVEEKFSSNFEKAWQIAIQPKEK